jgi:hypothetical protein
VARKKKLTVEVDESRLVKVPEVAPDGEPFMDVAYEHRCHHEPHECCGVTFEPGTCLTFRALADVPAEMFEDSALHIRAAKMGACRLQTTLRYTPMSAPEFNVLTAQAEAAKPVAPEPEPLPDEAEPEGGE